MPPGRVLASAAFLACSWTWAIGMYLPVHLARDFGWPGWIAFAIPNVVGAASVGVVLGRSGAARLLERHRGAVRAFTIVTLALHVFFLAWIGGRELPGLLGGGPTAAGVVLGVFLALAALFAARPHAWNVRAAPWVLAASVACGVAAAWTSGAARAFVLPPTEGAFSLAALALLSPALVFGFLFCPYLDVTLLRVRRELPAATAATAFGLGFGVLFVGMILMTLGYAGRLLTTGGFSFYVLGHMTVQSAFTCGAHWRCLEDEQPGWWRPRVAPAWIAGALLVAAAGVLGVVVLDRPPVREGYPAGRFVYDLFLSAYGLLFPAYVATLVLRRRSLAAASPRWRWHAWLGGVAAAAPSMYVGVIEQRHELVPVGVGVALLLPVLFARAFARRS